MSMGQADTQCDFLLADLHKLGGIEVLVDLLGDNSSDAVRAGAAFALGIAASNNEPFVIELSEHGGDELIIRLIEVSHKGVRLC